MASARKALRYSRHKELRILRKRGAAGAVATVAPVYLQGQHFATALTAAACIHALILLVLILIPNTKVTEIPVRILNIKLGEGAAAPAVDVDASIRPLAPQPNTGGVESELSRFFDPSRPANPQIIGHAINQAVKNTKENARAATTPPALAAPVPTVIPPSPPVPVPKPATLAAPAQPAKPEKPKSDAQKAVEAAAAQQFIRPQQFDYSPLGKLPQNGGSPVGNADSAASQAEILARYEQLISSWIQKFKIYPAEARAAGISGSGVVRLRIDRKGNVRFVTLDKKTGHDVLDKALLQMINMANPLPPAPEAYKAGDLFEFKIPISFNL